ncbi:MAG: trypsin-like serine protease [Nannocystaceae bacterium]
MKALPTTPLALSLSLALTSLVAACDAEPSERAPSADERIVGGSSTDIEQVPYQVSLQTLGGQHFCGGSIIDDEWILTAAHCIDGAPASALRVVAGFTRQTDSASQGQARSVAEIIAFPGYQTPERGRDIALLRLSSALDLSGPRARAIEIATPADIALTTAGTNALVSGWGTLSSGGGSPNTLQSVVVPLLSNAQADAAYAGISITSDQLGAGILGVGGVDACQGDSGGPLVVASADGLLLAGVVSWGFGCADPRFPGMYARVSSFADWVLANAEIDDGAAPPAAPAPNSCEDRCGEQAPAGCWCDSQCAGFGDCCGDVQTAC